ncbi:MAG: ABC transporter transmembrane domain-containing protein [Minisyncoccota bacterium]
MPKEGMKDVRIMPVVRAYAKATLRYPRALSVLVLGIFGMQFASIVVPLYLRQFINVLSENAPSAIVVGMLFGILVMYAAIGVINWISRLMQVSSLNRIETNVMADLENEAFSYLIAHSHDFFASNFAGTLTRRVNRYSRSYEQVLDSIAFNFFPTLLFAIGSITVLWLRSWWLGLGLLAWVLIFVGAQIILNRWRHPLRVERAAQDSKMTGVISDAIGNHSAIKLFANEKYERTNLAVVVSAWRDATRRSWGADNVIQEIQQALGITIEVGLLGAGVLLWERGLITVGDFALIQVYILGLVSQIWNFGNTLRRVYDAFADASEMVG